MDTYDHKSLAICAVYVAIREAGDIGIDGDRLHEKVKALSNEEISDAIIYLNRQMVIARRPDGPAWVIEKDPPCWRDERPLDALIEETVIIALRKETKKVSRLVHDVCVRLPWLHRSRISDIIQTMRDEYKLDLNEEGELYIVHSGEAFGSRDEKRSFGQAEQPTSIETEAKSLIQAQRWILASSRLNGSIESQAETLGLTHAVKAIGASSVESVRLVRNGQLQYGVRKLCEEVGEVSDVVSKCVDLGLPIDEPKMKDELSDALFFVAFLAEASGLNLADLVEHQLKKQHERFQGGWTVEKALKKP